MSSTSQPTDTRRMMGRREKCAATTKAGRPCRAWAKRESDFCGMHDRYGSTEPDPKSYQATLPSSLPDVTEQQLHHREKDLQKAIKKKKEARKRKEKKDAAQKEAKAKAETKKVAKAAQSLTPADLVTDHQALAYEFGAASLRTLEDCLRLIEFAVDDIIDLPPSATKSRTLVSAARTAGQLIIQAGIADKAVDWFKDNVKLVANVDLDQI